jgi:hypothetical protein
MDVDPFEARTTKDAAAARDVVARRDARRKCAECPMRNAVVDGVAAVACMFAASGRCVR